MQKLNKLALLFLVILMSSSCKKKEVTPNFATCSIIDDSASIKNTYRETHVNWRDYKLMKFDFGYKEIYPEINFKNLHVPGDVKPSGVAGYDAMFIRGLRFKNITDAVEDRYNLPNGIIFAIMTEESNGVDLLPNSLGDGGFGLCHMQPSVAHEFGLKIYKNCKGLKCNGKHKSCCKVSGVKQNHARDLKNLILRLNKDRKKLIQYDDRLNPIINIDAVGRMLASYMDGPQIKGKNFGPLRKAICRYAGETNYPDYWRDIKIYINHLNDQDFISGLEIKFNKANPNLKINGKRAGFKEYICFSQQQNYNYGLGEYKKLTKYKPLNSEAVKKTLKNFL